ncbi:50s ribosomal protein l1 [Cystoisospora suis]|uniref:50s ribosomal protein l1 n=1 Tax=Cystoisospora suis TaxID=483139 RepID=A0A2C6LB66_9APIC|nr:50s ribosomal protein l1 [Cystoisospora suis]
MNEPGLFLPGCPCVVTSASPSSPVSCWKDYRRHAPFYDNPPTAARSVSGSAADSSYYFPGETKCPSKLHADGEVWENYCLFSHPKSCQAQESACTEFREQDYRRGMISAPSSNNSQSPHATREKTAKRRARTRGRFGVYASRTSTVKMKDKQRSFFLVKPRSHTGKRRVTPSDFRVVFCGIRECFWLTVLYHTLVVSGVRSRVPGGPTQGVQTGSFFWREQPSWHFSPSSWPSSLYSLYPTVLEPPFFSTVTPESSSLYHMASSSSSRPSISASSCRSRSLTQHTCSSAAPQPSSSPCSPSLRNSLLNSLPTSPLPQENFPSLLFRLPSSVASSASFAPDSPDTISPSHRPPPPLPQALPSRTVSPVLGGERRSLGYLSSSSLRNGRSCRLSLQNESGVLQLQSRLLCPSAFLVLSLAPLPQSLSPPSRYSPPVRSRVSLCRPNTFQRGSTSTSSVWPLSCLSRSRSSVFDRVHGATLRGAGKDVEVSSLHFNSQSESICFQSATQTPKATSAWAHHIAGRAFSSVFSLTGCELSRHSDLSSNYLCATASSKEFTSCPVNSADSFQETSSLLSGERLSVGERRRQDRRLNWFKQYPYAPQHPAPPKPKSTAKIDLDPDKITPSNLPLPSRRLPSSLRWKALAETPVPSPVLNAATQAAVSSAREAVRTLQAAGTMARRRKGKSKKIKKIALARAAVATAVAAQKAPGLAALKSATEAAEQVLSSSFSVQQSGGGLSPSEREGGTENRQTAEGEGKDGVRDSILLRGSPSPGVSPKGGERSPSLLSMLYPAKDAIYPPDLAFFLVKQLSTAKFNETVELHVQLNLGTGPRGKGGRRSGPTISGRIRGYVTLPHGHLGQLGVVARPEGGEGEEMDREGDGVNPVESEDLTGPAGEQDLGQREAHQDLEDRSAIDIKKTEEAFSGSGSRGEAERNLQEEDEDVKEAHVEKGREHLGPGASEIEYDVRKSGGRPGKSESGIVRGKKRGGIWRRQRVIAAFVHKTDEERARQAGADIVGIEAVVDRIVSGKIDFGVLISTPDLVAKLTRYGKILGPKDLMPQVAWGTLTQDYVEAIRLYRQTTIPYQADRFNIIHIPIGIASMSKDELRENFEAALASINACRPPKTGNKFLQKVHISSTMGPGILIDMRHVKGTVAAQGSRHRNTREQS